MKKLMGGTLLVILALFAAPAGAGDDSGYGRTCPRFFGDATPANVGRHLGSGRLPTGERLSQPTTSVTLGRRLGTTGRVGRPGRTKQQPGPASVGWRLNAAGQASDSLQFCRTGPATIGRRMDAAGNAASGGRAAPRATSPKPYSYKPVTYRPYGLDPARR